MFYSNGFSNSLRLGDIVKGMVYAHPKIDTLVGSNDLRYSIEVEMSNYFVIMTPCCSIEKEGLLLAPLRKINSTWMGNNYFLKKFSIINERIEPLKSVGDDTWSRYSDDQKENLLSRGIGYACLDFFIFEPNDMLPLYDLEFKKAKINTNYYMVNFKDVVKLHSRDITRGKSKELVKMKILELSIETRGMLREKLTHFYGRVPDEDL